MYLETSGESDKVKSNAHSGTTSAGSSESGGEDIKHAEGGSGGQCNNDNFFDLKRVLRDGICSNSNHKTLNEIFNGAFDEFTEIKTVAHFCNYILYANKKKQENIMSKYFSDINK